MGINSTATYIYSHNQWNTSRPRTSQTLAKELNWGSQFACSWAVWLIGGSQIAAFFGLGTRNANTYSSWDSTFVRMGIHGHPRASAVASTSLMSNSAFLYRRAKTIPGPHQEQKPWNIWNSTFSVWVTMQAPEPHKKQKTYEFEDYTISV